jgi:hypothetical protein
MAPAQYLPVAGAERRRFPRVELAVPVGVQTAAAGRWTATSVNVSRGGVLVRCDRDLALALAREADAGPADLALWLDLPAQRGRVRRLTGRARFVYARSGAGADCEVGLEFTAFEGDGFERLQAFVLGAMRY